MIPDVCDHGKHWDFSPWEKGCCRNRWFQIRSRLLQISIDDPRLWRSWTTLRCFTIRTWLLQKPLVADSKQASSNQYVMDNMETFLNNKTVVADTVGLRFEAALFKSAPMFLVFGCHGQQWEVSQWDNGCCRNRWFHIRSRPLQISTDDLWFWLSWTTLRRFTIRAWFLQKPLVSDSKQTPSNQYRWS